MNCPMCGAERPLVRKSNAGRKSTAKTIALRKVCRFFCVGVKAAKRHGLDRWDDMAPLARKIMINEIRRRQA